MSKELKQLEEEFDSKTRGWHDKICGDIHDPDDFKCRCEVRTMKKILSKAHALGHKEGVEEGKTLSDKKWLRVLDEKGALTPEGKMMLEVLNTKREDMPGFEGTNEALDKLTIK